MEERSSERGRAASGKHYAAVGLGWDGWLPQNRGSYVRKQSPPPLIILRDHLIKTLGQASLTRRDRQLSKINFPSCSVCSNGILILLKRKEGRDLWWAAVCRVQIGRERKTEKTAAPGRKRPEGSKSSKERARDRQMETQRPGLAAGEDRAASRGEADTAGLHG